MDAISATTSTVDREVAERPAAVFGAKTPLVSDTEAHEILGRAADLQALTGIQSAPPPTSQTPRREATRTSGYRVDELRDAAVEAGIPAKYIDRAMAEHGIGETPRPPVVIDHTLRPGRNSILGSATQIQFELVIDGEMPEDDFDLLIDVIRTELAEGGAPGAVGRSFTWQSHPGKRSTQVSVFPRSGRTTIRVSESLRSVAGAAFGGLMAGVGGASMGIWGGVGAAVGSLGFAAVMWTGTVAVAYITARGIFGSVRARRERVLRKLVERLGATVQESIAASRKKLAAPTRPRIR